MSIGENIRRIRKERHMTQKELGNACGINEVQIRRYELENSIPRIETIGKIADALGVLVIEIISDGPMDELSMNKLINDENFMKQYTKTKEYIEIRQDCDRKDALMVISNNFSYLSKNEQKNSAKALSYLWRLNEKGQEKAIEQVEMLTKIDEYTKKD